MIFLLFREVRNILGLGNYRDYLDYYFFECLLSSISFLGYKGMDGGKKIFVVKDVLEI